MTLEDELGSHCYPRTLQRARQIAANERNFSGRTCTCDHYGEVVVAAAVASSNGWHDRYSTSVDLDSDMRRILDYRCTCPAYLNYDGMCKHCAALVLDFCNDPFAFQGYSDGLSARTTPLIQDLMRRTKNVAEASEFRDEIDLAVEMVLEFGSWSARFSIASTEATYVVKDIGALIDAVRNRKMLAHGKKLAFVHDREAFTPAARKLLSALERIMDERAQRRYPFGGSSTKRELSLDEPDLIALLDAVEAGYVTVMVSDGLHRNRVHAPIEKGDPPLQMRIVAEGGGHLLVADTRAEFAVSGASAWVYLEETFYRASERVAEAAPIVRELFEATGERLFVSDDDAPLFCATVLPVLESVARVAVPGDLAAMRPVAGRIEYFFDREGERIEASVQAVYGSARFVLGEAVRDIGDGGARQAGEPEGRDAEKPAPLRDERLEERALEAVWRYVSPAFTLALDDEESVLRLLYGGLAQLRGIGEVFTTPAFDRLLIDAKPQWRYGISLAGDLIRLDVSSDDLDEGELAEVLASYKAKKRFHRLRSGAFLSLEQAELARLATLVDDLGLAPADLADDTLELPTYRAFYLDREFSEAGRDESFTDYVKRFRSIEQSAFDPPEHLRAIMRPYQIEGFRWLSALCDLGFGGVLADEMGLGKSLQMIALLSARRDEAREIGPCLIVCPASLVYNWLAEFQGFAPDMRVRAIVGSKRERAAIRADEKAEVFVTSYDIARLDVSSFSEKRYFCHVLDEAQYIKNHSTLTTRAIKRTRSVHRFALTGTPMENRLSEIWSIFDFLMPGFLGSYARFHERFELGIVGGDEDLARRLRSLVGPFILRRLKRDVLPELPEKVETVVRVPLTGEQRKLYRAYEQSLRDRLNAQKKQTSSRANKRGLLPRNEMSRVEVLAELTRLRQIALDPGLVLEDYAGGAAKLGAIAELIEQARIGGEKMLLFSQFTSFLARVEDLLEESGVPYHKITGSTPKAKRVQLVDAFNGDDVPVFLVSLKAGGTGLNLTGATIVVHADPWWNAAAQNQATDRAHRIGQQHMVNVYKVIAADTIEERILALQEAKSDLADAIVSANDASSLASLSSEELYDLLLSDGEQGT